MMLKLVRRRVTAYSPTMLKDDDITPNVILEHMQAMEGRLLGEIRGVRTELLGELRGVEVRLTKRIDLLASQIDTIDKRVDAIEIESLPQRVTVLEAAVR